MLRYDNNRADKLFMNEYCKEIKHVTDNIAGLNQINEYRRAFEIGFAKRYGFNNAFSVGSGTDALQLALLSLNIERGDSVIMPALSYLTLPLVTKFVGAKVIPVDVKENDLTIDEKEVEKSITKDTKAIVAVHMFGNPCEMDSLLDIAKKHNLYLIEDCCQAIGSTYFEKPLGSFSDFSAFSFSHHKVLASLGGSASGMVVFKDQKYKDSLRRYIYISKGDTSLLKLGRKFDRMSLLDVATVKVKMKYSKIIFKSREKLKKSYENGLDKINEVKIFKDAEGRHSVKDDYLVFCKDRDKLNEYLRKHNIYCQLPYTPVYATGIHKESPKNFSVTENYFKKGLHLPLFTFMKNEEVGLVVDLIKKFYNKK